MEDSAAENHADDRKDCAMKTEEPMSDEHAGGGGGSNIAEQQSRKVKPALKKAPPGREEEDGQSDGGGGSKKEKKHLKWDEVAIEEHDQLRGTRMKIDEPNTPYTHYDSGAESDDSRRPKSPANQKPTLSWDALQTRLDSVAAVREAYPSSPSSHATGTDQSDGEDDAKKKEMRKLEFREHRKRHYNEMELVRKFRHDHPDGLLADDEDDEEGDADVEDGGKD